MKRSPRNRHREKHAYHMFSGGNRQHIIDLFLAGKCQENLDLSLSVLALLGAYTLPPFLVQLKRAIIYLRFKLEVQFRRLVKLGNCDSIMALAQRKRSTHERPHTADQQTTVSTSGPSEHRNQIKIAPVMGVHKTTISWELRLNRGLCGYRSHQAHRLAQARQMTKRRLR